MAKKQIGFRFPEQTQEKLKKLADHDERSQNSFLIVLISKEFERVFGSQEQYQESGVVVVNS